MQIDFKVGGKYNFQWKQEPGVHGEFLEIISDKKVVFTWSEADTKVTILLEPCKEGTKLQLTHEFIPDAYWNDRFKSGWTYGFNDLTKKLGNR